MKYAVAFFALIGFTQPAFAADAVPNATTAEKIGAAALKTQLGEYTFE